MNENNNQHYTINDLSALSALSNTYGSITNETMRKELINRKKSMEAQKKKVKVYKSEFQNNSNSNIDINLELLKSSNNDLNIQYENANEKIKNLSKKNKSLKKIINDKDKLITEYEEVVLKSKEKLQKINHEIKEEIIILKNNGGIEKLIQTSLKK